MKLDIFFSGKMDQFKKTIHGEFVSRIANFEKRIQQKDNMIKKLESIFKHLASNTTQSFIEDVTEDLLDQIFVNVSAGIRCDVCKFIAKS